MSFYNPIKLLKILFLDKYEKKYIKINSNKSKKNKLVQNILVQTPQDYFFLYFVDKYKRQKAEYNFIGYYPDSLHPTILEIILILPFLLKLLKFNLLKRKWIKLYEAAGVNIYLKQKVSLNIFLKLIKDSLRIFREIETKKDLLNITYNGIKCGELIYDSYLRFNKKYTLNPKDLNLIFFIYNCLYKVTFFENLKTNFEKYISSYSTYIKHGIPVRVLLSKKVDVFSYCSDNILFKKLSLNDYFHVPNYIEFKNDFEKLKNNNLKKEIVKKRINSLLNGTSKFTYLKKSPFYTNKNNFKDLKLDGVVFLHEFYDSPHSFRYMIFNDLFDWAFSVLKILKTSNLAIGVKPHPNNKNTNIINYLKKNFKEFYWFDKDESNKSIFNSGIKFGISNHGNVLFELAWHKIIPICTGENPYISYDYVFHADNEEILIKYLNSIDKLCFPNDLENQLISSFYMKNMYSANDLDINLDLEVYSKRELFSIKNLL